MKSTDHAWLQTAKKSAGWLMVLGILEVVAGALAIVGPLVAGLAVALVIGIALLLGGATRLFAAFMSDSFGAGTLGFLWGLLVLGTGFFLVIRPGVGLSTLTLVIAVTLFVDGLTRVFLSFRMRPVKGWAWMLAGGGLTVLFAIMIGRHFPTSAEWLVGTLVGVSLLLNGYTAISVAGAARTVAKKAERA